MSTSEIFSRNNELLIFVRTLRLSRYYNLFYVVIMTYYLVGTINYLVCTKLAFISTQRKRVFRHFQSYSKTVIGKISKFRDFQVLATFLSIERFYKHLVSKFLQYFKRKMFQNTNTVNLLFYARFNRFATNREKIKSR